MPRMLKLTPYCYPERVSNSHMTRDLNERLFDNDYYIERYVPTPSRGLTKEEIRRYKRIKYEEMDDGRTIVHRFSMFSEGRNPIQRAIRYILINIIQYYKGSRANDIDIIYTGSTPPTQGFLCALVKNKLKKRYGVEVPFVYNLQDIFPDSLVNAGFTQMGSILWKIGRRIEDYTYYNADKIIVISSSFKRNIMSKGVPEKKIVVVSNWVDMDKVHPIVRDDNTLFDELKIDRSKFIVVYAGNIGEAQGAEIIVEAAQKLEFYSDIQFVIFGAGSRFHDLIELIELESVSNVYITGLQPQERVSEVYSMGNVALITCKPGTGNAGLPSKTWSIFACDTPIIASFDESSSLADIIRDSGVGQCVNPGDSEALKVAIYDSYLRWKSGEGNNRSVRDFAYKIASKEFCTQKYIETMASVIKSTPQ